MATSQDSQRRPYPARDITPAYCCSNYLCTILTVVIIGLFFTGLALLDTRDLCYMELFANSVSVTNVSKANVSAVDWRFGLVTRSPVSGCKITLHRPIKSRLLRGDQVIISNPPSDEFDLVARDETNLAFETTVMPEVVNGSVIWDFRVEIVTQVKKKYHNRPDEFLMVSCSDIPVKFTADQAGNMIGSLLGFMRRCDYSVLE